MQVAFAGLRPKHKVDRSKGNQGKKKKADAASGQGTAGGTDDEEEAPEMSEQEPFSEEEGDDEEVEDEEDVEQDLEGDGEEELGNRWGPASQQPAADAGQMWPRKKDILRGTSSRVAYNKLKGRDLPDVKVMIADFEADFCIGGDKEAAYTTDSDFVASGTVLLIVGIRKYRSACIYRLLCFEFPFPSMQSSCCLQITSRKATHVRFPLHAERLMPGRTPGIPAPSLARSAHSRLA